MNSDEALTQLVNAHSGLGHMAMVAEHHNTKDYVTIFPYSAQRKIRTTITTNHGVPDYDDRVQIKGETDSVFPLCSYYLSQAG